MANRIPSATYRLQFNANFTLRDAISILDYLQDLGISHVYASPLLTSRRGSNHGYDVTDPTKIDPEVGGEEGLATLQSALQERDMGLLLDLVPNHMAASSENRWWMDVLEYGPESPSASYFDIDWKATSRVLENKLLLPFLGRPFGEALNEGELQVHWQDGRFIIKYGEQIFPVAPNSYFEILSQGEAEPKALREAGEAAVGEWQGILSVARSLATSDGAGTQVAAERRTKFENMRERLRELLSTSAEVAWVLGDALRIMNGRAGDAGSFTKLERLLSRQHYRLAFWQTVSEAINYRRFFSITDLVGLRVEDPAVFNATHELAIRTGLQTKCGFRIDHIDGLREPLIYLNRLKEGLTGGQANGGEPYIVVEKILGRNEWLPEEWPVAGTTGYDYMNAANRLMVDAKNGDELEEVYVRWTGVRSDFEDLLYEKKKLVMRTLLAVEMRALGRGLVELARDDRYARELHPMELMEALVEVTACLGVYRTYIQTLDVPETAKKLLGSAIERARTRRPTLGRAYFDFLSDLLLLAAPEHVRPEQRESRRSLVKQWQQVTGSIMAKGFEDTALYVYFPLSSLNEVGGDPRVRDTRAPGFHEFIAQRREKWPDSMNATTTHDTKRSEDVRARIAVLSEMPKRWEASLKQWSKVNEPWTSRGNGGVVPDRNEQYLFYQTLIGTWPVREEDWREFVPRLQDYLIKATREAQVHTRWKQPNQEHEKALRDFVERVLDRERNREFCASFGRLRQTTALYGMLNGLGQALLKAMAPGMPDCYQGAELWDLRLVDPDNRGAVDFEERRRMLASVREAEKSEEGVEEMLASWCDGRVKMHVLMTALKKREAEAELFSKGEYLPLRVKGRHEGRVFAFAREWRGNWAMAVMPQCVASVEAPVMGRRKRREFWKETAVVVPEGAPREWRNILGGARGAGDTASVRGAGGAAGGGVLVRDGDELNMGDAFEAFPVALLAPVAR